MIVLPNLLRCGSYGPQNRLPAQHATLPTKNIPAEPRPANWATTDRTAGFRILVVDDNRDAADAMSLLLGQLGNQVRTAYGGADAVRMFKSFVPHVIVLDIGMPGIDGLEVTRQIRALPRGKNVLIIALTGSSSRKDKNLSQEAGIDHHSVKPVDVIILQGIIEVRAGMKRQANLNASLSESVG